MALWLIVIMSNSSRSNSDNGSEMNDFTYNDYNGNDGSYYNNVNNSYI